MKQKAYDAECCAAREKNDHERVLAEAKAREAMMVKATADKEKHAAAVARRAKMFADLKAEEEAEEKRLSHDLMHEVGASTRPAGINGYRSLHHYPQVMLVASRSGVADFHGDFDSEQGPTDCPVPSGYRWAGRLEAETLFGDFPCPPTKWHDADVQPSRAHGTDYPQRAAESLNADKSRQDGPVPKPYHKYYFDQDGWTGYTYEGVSRQCFLFSDSQVVGGVLHAASDEGMVSSWAPNDIVSACSHGGFGGIVCIRDGFYTRETRMAHTDYPPAFPRTATNAGGDHYILDMSGRNFNDYSGSDGADVLPVETFDTRDRQERP